MRQGYRCDKCKASRRKCVVNPFHRETCTRCRKNKTPCSNVFQPHGGNQMVFAYRAYCWLRSASSPKHYNFAVKRVDDPKMQAVESVPTWFYKAREKATARDLILLCDEDHENAESVPLPPCRLARPIVFERTEATLGKRKEATTANTTSRSKRTIASSRSKQMAKKTASRKRQVWPRYPAVASVSRSYNVTIQGASTKTRQRPVPPADEPSPDDRSIIIPVEISDTEMADAAEDDTHEDTLSGSRENANVHIDESSDSGGDSDTDGNSTNGTEKSADSDLDHPRDRRQKRRDTETGLATELAGLSAAVRLLATTREPGEGGSRQVDSASRIVKLEKRVEALETKMKRQEEDIQEIVAKAVAEALKAQLSSMSFWGSHGEPGSSSVRKRNRPLLE